MDCSIIRICLLFLFVPMMAVVNSLDNCNFQCDGGMKGKLESFPVPANTGLYGRPGKMGAKGEPGEKGVAGTPCTCNFSVLERRIAQLEKMVTNFMKGQFKPQVTSPTRPTLPPQSNPKPPVGGKACGSAQTVTQASGTGRPDVYTFRLPQLTSAITMACDRTTDGGDWMVIQQRFDDSTNFQRPWSEYVAGFGEKTGNYWLGLENIYKLTKDSEYQLRVDLMDFSNVKKFAKYSTFKVEGADTKYKLTVSGYDSSSTAPDNMRLHSGMKFTTIDEDNDILKDKNCADLSMGGWWYKKCHTANLNGVYYTDGVAKAYATGISWLQWTGYTKSLKMVQMKIKPKN